MLKRRDMLTALVAAAVGSQMAPLTSFAQSGEGKRRIPWRNWSGLQECFPEARKAPASVAELQELLASTEGVVRPVGAGHSFMPLVPTDDTIVSLSRLSGVVNHDEETLQATIMAGSRLGDIGAPLSERGQALINMPDIDQQSLAGCLGTATHGTGAGLMCLSAYATGLQLATADGELIDCDASNNSDIFEAARVSMGSLGIITKVRMQNQAPYRLRRERVFREFDEILTIAQDLADKHRNFEFYYVPFSGMGWTDVHDLTDEPYLETEKIDDNEEAMALKTARDWLSWSPALREVILGGYARTLSTEVTIERSWKNYASERNVRFNEMEYHLPRETGLQALREVREALETQHHEVFLPLEVRFVKGDDLWLSPFTGRDSISIAVHRFFEEDHEPLFKTIEPILRKYEGRPHWGKLNTLDREQLRALYPRWDDFAVVRNKLDPEGRFLNDYLRNLFA